VSPLRTESAYEDTSKGLGNEDGELVAPTWEASLVLNLTTSGVRFHKHKVMHQLKLKTNAHLIRFAIESGILKS
jgi:hypothetical protein